MTSETSRPAVMSELYSLWSIQESLLQSYRMIFITSEAIFLSVAAAFVAAKEPLLALVLAIPGITLMCMWVPITGTRAKFVLFAQEMIRAAEDGNPPSHPLKQFKERQREDELLDAISPHPTRQRLEVLLPYLFWVAWIFLALVALYLGARA